MIVFLIAFPDAVAVIALRPETRKNDYYSCSDYTNIKNNFKGKYETKVIKT